MVVPGRFRGLDSLTHHNKKGLTGREAKLKLKG